MSNGSIWWECYYFVFFFTLKTHKNIDMDLGWFLGFALISSFRPFFVFLEAIDLFNKVPMVFPKYFGSKWVEMSFWVKTKPCFFCHTSGRILGIADDMSFLKKMVGVDDALFTLLYLQKKGMHACPWLYRPGP